MRVPNTRSILGERGSTALAEVVERTRPITLAREQRLPVPEAFESLVPGGLRRGTVVSTGGRAATSLALALVGEASARGSWVAAVGLPGLGLVAAKELGLDLDRVAVVSPPSAGRWATVVAALVDGVDVVLTRSPRRSRPQEARRLSARVKERGAVVVLVSSPRWHEGPDLRLTGIDVVWEGLGEGHGHLRARRVSVERTGRRELARTRRAELWLPGLDGAVARADPAPARLRAVG